MRKFKILKLFRLIKMKPVIKRPYAKNNYETIVPTLSLYYKN